MFKSVRYFVLIVTLAVLSRSVFAESEEKAPPTHAMYGQILGPDRQPIPDATIQVYVRDDTSFIPQIGSDGQPKNVFQKLATWMTNAEGKFQGDFKTGKPLCIVHITKSGWPSTTATVSIHLGGRSAAPGPIPFDLEMRPGVPCQVQVVDRENRPLSGVAIHRISAGRYFENSYNAFAVDTQVATTNAEGTATVDLIPDAAQIVWCDSEGYVPQRVVVSPANVTVHDTFPNIQTDHRIFDREKPLLLTMQRAASLRGRIFDGETPLANTPVFVEKVDIREKLPNGTAAVPAVQAVTDEEGRFLVAEVPDFNVRVIAQQGDRFAIAPAVRPTEAQNLELKLEPGSRMTGVVIDVDSKLPVTMENGQVQMSGAWGHRFLGVIQPDGTFSIPCPHGENGSVRLVPHPLWRDPQSAFMSASPGTTLTVLVERKVSPMTDREVLAELPRFPSDYSLAEGQAVRRIRRPYPLSREAFFQSFRIHDLPNPDWLKMEVYERFEFQREGETVSPSVVVFRYGEDHRFSVQPVPQMMLSSLINPVFKRLSSRRLQIRAPYPQNVRGADLVVRDSATLEELVAGVNAAFSEEPQIPYRLSIKEDKFTTLVASGSPSAEKADQPISLRFVPEGFESGAAQRIQVKWSSILRTIQNVTNSELEEQPTADPDLKAVELSFGAVKRPTTGALTREQIAELQAAEVKLRAAQRELIPRVLKEQLGVDVQFVEKMLPVVVVEPARK